MDFIGNCINSVIEYETPKVVKVHNTGIGLLRRGLQLGIILYVGLYQLFFAQGYQEFAGIESSVTTKVKGYSFSELPDSNFSIEERRRYERVWDEADYVIPPAENGAFFVTTNIVITPNQTWGVCPEDPREVPVKCTVDDPLTNRSTACLKNRSFHKSHGPQTGRCVPSDRVPDISVCEIYSWCPVEDDRLLLGTTRPLITGSESHTAFIKNSIRFSHFGESFHRNNMPNGVCVYNFSDPSTHLCPIFKLGDMIEAAGGNYTKMAVKGGVVAIHIDWKCNLDLDFLNNCLPRYAFRLLDTYGWNFRHAYFHEEDRRTLYKAYGIKFVIIVQGRAGKFDLKNTVINIVAGLGLLSFITMFCDFILLHYVDERKIVREKKFESLENRNVLSSLINMVSTSHDGNQDSGSRNQMVEELSKRDLRPVISTSTPLLEDFLHTNNCPSAYNGRIACHSCTCINRFHMEKNNLCKERNDAARIISRKQKNLTKDDSLMSAEHKLLLGSVNGSCDGLAPEPSESSSLQQLVNQSAGSVGGSCGWYAHNAEHLGKDQSRSGGGGGGCTECSLATLISELADCPEDATFILRRKSDADSCDDIISHESSMIKHQVTELSKLCHNNGAGGQITLHVSSQV